MMKILKLSFTLAVALLLTLWTGQALAVFSQCPTDNWPAEQDAGEDLDGDGVIDYEDPDVVCMHITAGDGFTTMADGYPQYIFKIGRAHV